MGGKTYIQNDLRIKPSQLGTPKEKVAQVTPKVEIPRTKTPVIKTSGVKVNKGKEEVKKHNKTDNNVSKSGSRGDVTM